MIFNKKGKLGDQVTISIYLFLMFVIAGGIAIGAYIFYGDEYDFRPIEAEILNYNIRQCIFSNEIDWNKGEEFFSRCGLDKETIEGSNIIQINIDNKEVHASNKGKVEECRFTGAKKNINYPKCAIKEFEFEGKKYEVVTGSFQTARRIND